jgi:multidrug resistance protein, MATE family
MRYNRHEIRAEAGRILSLAWPIALTGLNWTLMHLIDVAFVGWAGTFELGALAAGRSLTFISIVMGLAALSGVLVFTARAEGAGYLEGTGEVLHGAILLGLIIGSVLLAILNLWNVPLLHTIGVSEELRAPGGAVVAAMALAFPPQLMLAGASYFLEGISRPRRVMVVNLAMLPLNALLAWAWVGGNLGFPALGAVGAGYATSTASAAGALAMLVLCWSLPRARERGVRDLSPAALRRALRQLPKLAAFGLVPAMAAGLELAGFSWLIALSTQLGIVTAAAFQAMFSLHNLTFALAMGFGSAAGVRVGNAVGAGERSEALPRTLIAAVLAIVSLGCIAAIFGFAARWIVLPLSDDPQVLVLAAALLALMAPFMLFDGLQYVLTYALRSLGDQVRAGINSVIAFFVVTGALGWWLVRTDWGASGLVLAAGAGMVTCALLQGLRLRTLLREPSPAR